MSLLPQTGHLEYQGPKMHCIIHRLIIQKWGCIALTDLKGPAGTYDIKYMGRTWTIIVQDKVGFLLDDAWTNWWRQGGGRIYPQGQRVVGIQFPRMGWRRGLFLTNVYAPTSDSTVGERQQLRDQITTVLGMKQPTSLILILGDFNAELGNNQDMHTPGREAMGCFGNPKISQAGLEWRIWAVQQGFKDCSSRFQLGQRCTWAHPRFHSEHELDHILIHESALWHLQGCRILKDGPSVNWTWTPYTDHNPVEISLRHGKLWFPNKKSRTHTPKPDVQKLRSNPDLRQIWCQEVESKLQETETPLHGDPQEAHQK